MRPRKKDRHLPPCIYHKHGAYWYVKNGKWERLGVDLSGALAEYGRRQGQNKGSMDTVIDETLSILKPRIAANTYKQYTIAADKLKRILQEFNPEQVQPKHVAQIRRSLSNTPNMANRCLSFLRQVFDYALEQQMIDSNPAIGIKRLEEQKRERLLTQAEYGAIYAHAVPRLQVIMDLLFLTGQRVSDVLNIQRADIKDEGIYFRQQKTRKQLLVRWSPELRAVVERAKALHGNIKAFTLLHNRKGKPPDYSVVRHFEFVFLYGPRFFGVGAALSAKPTIQFMSSAVSLRPAAMAGVTFRLL